MRRHMKLPESLKVTKARRTAVELMQRELELHELFCPGECTTKLTGVLVAAFEKCGNAAGLHAGGSDHIFLGDAEQAAQLKRVPKSSHNLNGTFESTEEESVDGQYLVRLKQSYLPFCR